MTNRRRNAWTWPLIALTALLAIVLVGTILALLSGCSAGQSYGGGGQQAPAEPKAVKQGAGAGFAEHEIMLSDGRTVVCLTWSDHSLMSDTTSSGLSCDWTDAEGTE